MKISIVSLFPALHQAFCETSLIGRAVNRGLISCNVVPVLEACAPKERVDAPTFGHRAGMAIRPEIVARVCDEQEQKHGKPFRIFFSPRGKRLTQDLVRTIADQAQARGHLLLFAGRYEDVDARAEKEYADLVLSIGDFVLMGGDLPAQLVMEAVLRYIPGVIQQSESVERDSFSGPFVDAPAYTAPAVWRNYTVPDIIRSGDHAKIEAWEQNEMARATVLHHFDWLRTHTLTPPQKELVIRHIPNHYVALMHEHILLPQDRIGTTSVTSIDIHDIARSARTYGLQGFFIVTPLIDQQKIVRSLLEFWQQGEGLTYNPDRCKALATTELAASYETVLDRIRTLEGKDPVIIATSARTSPGKACISYFNQERVWAENRPILLLLGTGRGLDPEICQQATYLLSPLEGYSDFNHLSVRSAAAIIFDRWLGMNIRS